MPPRRRPSKNQFADRLERQHVRRVFALDEARFGLKVRHRRRWCPFGARPPWIHADQYKWFWLYVALEPTTGESVVLYLPHADGICFERFLHEIRRAVPEVPLALVLDSSGSHTNQHIHWPAGVKRIPLPPYSPELNPPERWFEELRKTLANRIFDTIADLETALTVTLRRYWDNPAKLVQLTAFPWWREAVQSITSS